MIIFIICAFAILGLTTTNTHASPPLEATKMLFDVLKDGSNVTVQGKTVNAIPKGTDPNEFKWSGPVSYNETYTGDKSFLGFETAQVVMTMSWLYDGTYISNFRVDADANVTVGYTVDVQVETDNSYFNKDGYVELPYRATVIWRNKIGNTKRTTYKGVVFGNGLGRSGL